jgi:5'-methylthioadenosine phosphorylase
MAEAKIGIIGGTGLYQMPGLEEARALEVDTPFGPPSAPIVIGRLGGKRVAFLARHGRGHVHIPGEVPARANIYALKSLGVERIVSISAVGSMREEIHPLDIVIPDQYVDRTRGRPSTMFGRGIAVHISFEPPACPHLREQLYQACLQAGARVHYGGTYICIEGPAFSTKAESRIYRQWGMDVIGMTALPEAKLAREAEICYATLAFATDYDVWHESEAGVTVDMILQNLHKNTAMAQQVICNVVPMLDGERDCPCANALATAIVTAPEAMPQEEKERMALLLCKYLPA